MVARLCLRRRLDRVTEVVILRSEDTNNLDMCVFRYIKSIKSWFRVAEKG